MASISYKDGHSELIVLGEVVTDENRMRLLDMDYGYSLASPTKDLIAYARGTWPGVVDFPKRDRFVKILETALRELDVEYELKRD